MVRGISAQCWPGVAFAGERRTARSRTISRPRGVFGFLGVVVRAPPAIIPQTMIDTQVAACEPRGGRNGIADGLCKSMLRLERRAFRYHIRCAAPGTET